MAATIPMSITEIFSPFGVLSASDLSQALPVRSMDPRRTPKAIMQPAKKATNIVGYAEARNVARTAIQQVLNKQYSAESTVGHRLRSAANASASASATSFTPRAEAKAGAKAETEAITAGDTSSFEATEIVLFVRNGTVYEFAVEVNVNIDYEPQFQSNPPDATSSTNPLWCNVTRSFSLLFSTSFAFTRVVEKDPPFAEGSMAMPTLVECQGADGDDCTVCIEPNSDEKDETNIEVRVRDRNLFERMATATGNLHAVVQKMSCTS